MPSRLAKLFPVGVLAAAALLAACPGPSRVTVNSLDCTADRVVQRDSGGPRLIALTCRISVSGGGTTEPTIETRHDTVPNPDPGI